MFIKRTSDVIVICPFADNEEDAALKWNVRVFPSDSLIQIGGISHPIEAAKLKAEALQKAIEIAEEWQHARAHAVFEDHLPSRGETE